MEVFRCHCDSVGFCGATEELLPGLSLERWSLPKGALLQNDRFRRGYGAASEWLRRVKSLKRGDLIRLRHLTTYKSRGAIQPTPFARAGKRASMALINS